MLNPLLIIISALSFLGYGITCIGTEHMRREFARYGLAGQRMLVGALQLVAALSLFAGFSTPWLGQAAATGLALMMLVGVLVRLRIKDRLILVFPAIFYLVLNAYLAVAAF